MKNDNGKARHLNRSEMYSMRNQQLTFNNKNNVGCSYSSEGRSTCLQKECPLLLHLTLEWHLVYYHLELSNRSARSMLNGYLFNSRYLAKAL